MNVKINIIISLIFFFIYTSTLSPTYCMNEYETNDESAINNKQQLFETSPKFTAIELKNLDDSIVDDSINLPSRQVPTGIMESLGGNAMCSLSCTSGATLGALGGLFYLYFHVGFETTNSALTYIATPFSIGIAIGSFTGCGIGYCLKKYIEREKKYL